MNIYKRYDNAQDDTCSTTLVGDSLLIKTSYISEANKNEIFLQLNFTTQDSVYKVICVPTIVLEMMIIGRFLLFEQVYILTKKGLSMNIVIIRSRCR